jgi:cell division protein FtsL
MARVLTFAAGALTIAAATGLYLLKHDTQRLESEVHRLERAVEKAESDIAVLKAEKAYLARPDRIDTLARRQGLGPARESQYRRVAPRGPQPASAPPSLAAELSDAEALEAARRILMPGPGARP